jgi:AcrR family transcriptional regulator
MAVPVIPLPSREDPVAASLIGAAQSLLAERGPAATTTRHIASTAGVTTGALYRRYEGKSRLLADVLLTQLDPERYAWTWDLIAALASPDPYLAAGDVLADRVVATSGNLREQRILIQVGVAARNDSDLRQQVRDRIEAAMEARRDMVRHFVDEDVVRDDVDPEGVAWAFQALPVGIRTCLPLVDSLPGDEVRSAMRSMLLSAARRT